MHVFKFELKEFEYVEFPEVIFHSYTFWNWLSEHKTFLIYNSSVQDTFDPFNNFGEGGLVNCYATRLLL